ncbi:replication protein H [Halobacteriales archaeon QS_3_64_16]|nr:MAG: replication protein H [Halobacteriales archaeon QS_3_64_16]
MYAVVGCGDCGAFWVVESEPETTGCPRCGKRHQYERLKRFLETEDADEARQARAALLADREGYSDAFSEVESFAEMDDRIEDSGIEEATYLEASGLDAESVAAAGERAEGGTRDSSNRQEILTEALEALDRPTEAEVLEYATDRGVPAADAERLLEKLRRQGAVSATGGRYRLL